MLSPILKFKVNSPNTPPTILLPVKEHDQIAAVHERFLDRLLDVTDQEVICQLTGDKGPVEAAVQVSTMLKFWAGVWEEPIEDANYWCTFGMGVPKAGQPVSTVLELTYLTEGVSKDFGAFWAVDPETKTHYLLHRGQLEGKASCVQPLHFFKFWQGAIHRISVNGVPCVCAEVCILESEEFSEQLRTFVKRVYQMTRMIKGY